jgi:hypothetical protein
MGAYQYPQVPRASQFGTNEPASRPPIQDSRFSWVDTPAEARAYTWQRNARSESSSEIPPLPQVPDHLYQASPQPNLNTVSRADQPSGPTTTQLPLEPDRSPAPAYSLPHAPNAQQLHSESTSYPTEAEQIAHFHHQHSQQQPQQPRHRDHQHSLDVKPLDTMQYTQMPPPTHLPHPSSQQPTFPLAPDENPLSPTTPTRL